MIPLHSDFSRNLLWTTHTEDSMGLFRIFKCLATVPCAHLWVICISHGLMASVPRGLSVLCVMLEQMYLSQCPQQCYPCLDYPGSMQWFEIWWRWGKMNFWLVVFGGQFYRPLERDTTKSLLPAHCCSSVPLLNPKRLQDKALSVKKKTWALPKNWGTGLPCGKGSL